jgi:isopentenyldiphosphate isomerase
MERIDLYNEERILTGKTVKRSEHRPSGTGDDLRLVVHVCIFNSAGELLLQQRSMKKDAFPGFWDVSAAGGVAAGETGRQGAEREVREELGYQLDLTDVRPSVTVNYDGGFDDFYLVVRDDVNVSQLQLQEEEVADARWAGQEEVRAMLNRGEFVPYPASFLEFLFEMRDTFGFHGK